MTLVLLLTLAVSFGIQAWIEGGIFGGITIFNIFLGFFQTLKAEKTIESLKPLGSPNASFSTGDSVPADIRLLTSINLKADETMLTGESLPALKNGNTTLKA
ncbi:hypothetical protein BU25DRAFT_461030 [Macroventuria anomochaeta]|uniref:Uncharacterized protein n=1 Tax=Macroventuria anomochaeta TaxID=301207 RepID=A0ACB6RRA7_9PLEO|nr:uncharacterized protein BU25DRAFT_461030 [Macroventuria anomochaeta]KAF2624495.1 hypothetical protein BU25DRAFT_461030 [Macroventuria anomochaeta]